MLELKQVVRDTAPIFEKDLVLPEPPIKYKDQIEALDKASLMRQKNACIYEMRNWQAIEMGFKAVTYKEMVEMLMGEPHTNYEEGEKQKIEYVYKHSNGNIETDWTGSVGIYKKVEKKGLWYYPPFGKVTKWEVHSGKLDYLKREIPYGVVLRINKLKELKLFNAFGAVAPKEAWWSQKEIDPIIFGAIWEMPPDDQGKITTAGNSKLYFIAKW